MPEENAKGLTIQKVRSADPLFLNGSGKHAYRSGSNSSEDDVPLSMRFMHKPLRAIEELRKASDDTIDRTRRNSLRNAFRSTSSDDTADGSPSLPVNGSSGLLEKVKLVRKKSGEIVKPLLKESFLTANNRSRSLPSTPTYKLVHFGGDNDVRYFKMKDKPTAILASNSPTLFPEDDDTSIPDLDDYSLASDSESERGFSLLNQTSMSNYFDYYDDELNLHVDTPVRAGKRADITRYPKSEWDLKLIDFPLLSYHANIVLRSMLVFLERIFLSVDNKYLLGQIAVKNLSYEKKVTIRYTLDNWATIVEIPCLYVPDVPPVLKAHGYDRFVFKIPLESFFNGFPGASASDSEDHICQLCVKFNSSTSEHWDNNDDKNYLFILNRKSKIAPVPFNTNTSAPNKELPQAAKTKQEAHIKKPKYSLSYLKKKISGSSALASPSPAISTPKEEEPPSEKKTLPQKTECNDFELNNYYLLSPLFSSLNNKDAEDLMRGEQRSLGRTVTRGRPTPPVSLKSTDAMDEDSVSPDDEAPISPMTVPRNSNDRLKQMSYKELLESYCFFTPPREGNTSKSTLVMSDESGSNYNENFSTTKPINCTDGGSVFTVSSCLKH